LRCLDGRAGCAVVWRNGDEWECERHSLGKKKEVIDAEIYAIERGLRKATDIVSAIETAKVVIFSDSVAAIQPVQNDELGPGQRMAKNAVQWNNKIMGKGADIKYRRVPSHEGVEGNGKVDEQAKVAT
jgi:ribonuclease HI